MQKKRKPTLAYITGDWSWGTEPLQPNGCAWYRCSLPMRELQSRGWTTGLGFPGFTEERGFGLILDDGRIVHGWDIIVFKLLMQKEVLQRMDRAKELGQTIVVDVDDWFDGLSASNRAFSVTDPQNNSENNREIYAQIIQKSDAIITSTPFLYEYYAKKHNNVFMVRNGIDNERWRKQIKSPRGRIRVGWVGATPWRSNDLEQLTPWFSDFIQNQNLFFHHSGHTDNSPVASELLGVPDKCSKRMGMAPISHYPELFKPIDIGIVPLNNIPFNHAKSYIKGLEYAAAGVPFISSYSPEYQYLADNGIGRIANNQKEWEQHLEDLLDANTRIAEIKSNYNELEKFSIGARGNDWDETFRIILEQKTGA